MDIEDRKKTLEPFNTGVSGEIWNSTDAKKVVLDNSYYFFVYAVLAVSVYLFGFIESFELPFSLYLPLATSLFILTFTIILRLKMSRAAAYLLLAYSLIYLFESAVLAPGYLGVLVPIMLVLASFRVVKATRAFHHYENHEQQASNK